MNKVLFNNNYSILLKFMQTSWSDIADNHQNGGLFTFLIPRRYGNTTMMETILENGFDKNFDINTKCLSLGQKLHHKYTDFTLCKTITSKTVLLIDDYSHYTKGEIDKEIEEIVNTGGWVFRVGQPHKDNDYDGLCDLGVFYSYPCEKE